MTRTKQEKLHNAIRAALYLPAVMSIVAPTSAHAIAFTAKATGAWEATGTTTWNQAGSPGASIDTDGVTINNASGPAITYSAATGTRTIASLTIGNAAKNTVTITGGSLRVTGNTAIGNGATIASGNQNTLAVQGGTLTTGTVNNTASGLGSGLVTVSGGTLQSTTFNNNISGANLGTVLVSEGTLSNSGTFTNNGATTVSGTGTLSSGTFTNSSTGTVTVTGGSLTATIVNNANAIAVSGGSFGGADTAYNQTVSTGSLSISGGTANLGNTSISAGTVTLGSSGSLTLNGSTAISGGTVDVQGGTLTNAAGQTLSNTGGTITMSGGTLINQGTFNSTAGVTSITGGTVTNSGTFSLTGSGALSATTVNQNGGSLNLSAGGGATHNVGTLSLNGGTVTLGADNNVVVSSDYNNSNFGSGNSFSARANITGTGLINSSSATAATDQVVTGALVSNGSSANPTLTFGNVHVGEAVTSSYSIGNSAVSGPTLRGAIQVGGVDSKLSGSGVTAGDWIVPAGASPLSQDVTLTVGSAGLYTVNQTVTLANNFDNVTDQTLTIKNADDAAAYNYADADILKTGGAGSITTGETLNYVLDFGSVVQGSGGGVLTADLGIFNDGNGNNAFTDALRGTWDLLDGLIDAFAASHLENITSNLLAGNTATGSWISFDTSTIGTFSDSIVFNPTSWNDAFGVGSNWGQPFVNAITLTITGIVTAAGPGPQPAPEPATLWLFGGATLGLAASRRRRGVKS